MSDKKISFIQSFSFVAGMITFTIISSLFSEIFAYTIDIIHINELLYNLVSNHPIIFACIGFFFSIIIAMIVRVLSNSSSEIAQRVLNYLNGEDIKSNSESEILENQPLKNNDIQNIENNIATEQENILTPEQIKKNELINILAKDRATLERINRTIKIVLRRGNVNLIIGIISAIFGICILGYFIKYGSLPHGDNLTNMQIMFILFPRISLIAILEICAIFFINLYKKSLIEEKYYQNELTNLETKFLALELAFHTEKDDLIDKAIENLLTTERNQETQGNSKEDDDKIIEILPKLIEKVGDKE